MLATIRVAEDLLLTLPQVEIETQHLFHGGMYARTIRIPAGVVLTGAWVKIPTLLILHGDAEVLNFDGWMDVRGYAVLAGCAGRKQVFFARSDVSMTMVFPTLATTVDEAEREFTDEFERLMSRKARKE